jgi:hypothetical protein
MGRPPAPRGEVDAERLPKPLPTPAASSKLPVKPQPIAKPEEMSDSIEIILTKESETNIETPPKISHRRKRSEQSVDFFESAEGTHSCSQCTFVAKNTHGLNIHVSRAHSQAPRIFSCPSCSHATFTASLLQDHLKRNTRGRKQKRSAPNAALKALTL